MKKNNLDQFYTNPKVIPKLINKINAVLKRTNMEISSINWIEPSAGSGNFIDCLIKKYKNPNIKAFDIEPHKNSFVQKKDFLKLKSVFNQKNVVIGNPPFGKRSKLAIEFVNKSLEWADVVAFILPNQFKRYLTQNKIHPKAKLISEIKMDENAFLLNDRAYNVNCVFQIWVNSENPIFDGMRNKRIRIKPKLKHKDFKTYIHNNTELTLKYFDKQRYQWDYAIPRQGYYDYNKIIEDENKLNPKIQYFFIKCNNDKCHQVVKEMNFSKLSETNTTIPGFSTFDFVKEFKKQKRFLIL